MDSNIVASSPFLRLAGLWTRDLPFRQTSILFSYRAVGRSENPGGGGGQVEISDESKPS